MFVRTLRKRVSNAAGVMAKALVPKSELAWAAQPGEMLKLQIINVMKKFAFIQTWSETS